MGAPGGWSAERVRRLFDETVRQLPMGVAVFDRDMRYVTVNPGWLDVHGCDDDRQVIGRTHYEVFPEIREEWRETHRRCLAGATEQCAADVFVRADGEKEHLRWLIAPWRDESDEIAGIIIYAEGISEQVLTRQRLEERESLIRDLFEESPFGLNLCRMDGLWLQSNPAFLEIIGYSREEADGGLTYWQLTPRKYDADEAVQLEKLRTTRRYGPYEKEFVRKDGTPRAGAPQRVRRRARGRAVHLVADRGHDRPAGARGKARGRATEGHPGLEARDGRRDGRGRRARDQQSAGHHRGVCVRARKNAR